MGDGERLIAGRYRLTRRLGSGGMGVVWHAVDERLHRPVAVKELRLPPHLSGAEAEEAKLRAMRESRIAARVQHPHVIAIYDVVEDDGHPCLVMEYLPSKSLSEVLAERGTLSAGEVAQLGTQAARALEAAHVAGVVHRDVKPGNVLLGDGSTAKIADFGISRAVGDVTITATGLISGTPAYLAPEVAKGLEATSASDVFSLGSTLYTAVEGAPPFGLHDNPIALLHHVATGDVTPPRLAGPLSGVLLEMLAREPERRPGMREVAERLAVAAGRTPTRSAARVGGQGRARSAPPEHTSTLPAPDATPPDLRTSPSTTTTPPTGQRPAEAVGSTPRLRFEPGSSAGLGRSGSGAEAGSPGVGAPLGPVASSRGSEASATDGGSVPSAPGEGSGPAPDARADTGAEQRLSIFSSPLTAEVEARRDRSSRRRAWMAVGIAAVLVAASLVVVLVLTKGRAPDRGAHGSGGATTSQGSPSPRSTAQSKPPRTTPPRITTVEGLEDYYALLPGKTLEGYSRLTPRYKGTVPNGYSGYKGFWDGIRSVTISNVYEWGGGNRLEARLTYTKTNGETSRERRVFTMVKGRDGRWLIDESRVVPLSR